MKLCVGKKERKTCTKYIKRKTNTIVQCEKTKKNVYIVITYEKGTEKQ